MHVFLTGITWKVIKGPMFHEDVYCYFLKVDLKPWDGEEALTVNHQLYSKTVSHQQNCKKSMQNSYLIRT